MANSRHRGAWLTDPLNEYFYGRYVESSAQLAALLTYHVDVGHCSSLASSVSLELLPRLLPIAGKLSSHVVS